MKKFTELAYKIIDREGGLVEHKNDRGGITNFGVSLRFLKTVDIETGDIDGDGDVDRDDIIALSKEDAAAIFLEKFLVEPNLDKLPLNTVDFAFDCSVHHGPVGAGRILQRALNQMLNMPLKVDGIVGSRTIAATRRLNTQALLDNLIDQRIKMFERIVANDPEQEVFLRGWVRRALSFKECA